MSKAFLSLRPEDRKFAFDDAAQRLRMAPVILEKDFWVSWLLGLLFAQPELAPHLVFKGGTSLSKVFGVIDRFSEDIDLCLVPEFVGADAMAFDALDSRIKRDAAVMEMQRLCGLKAQNVVAPLLEAAMRRHWARPFQVPGCAMNWMAMRNHPSCTSAIRPPRLRASSTCGAR